MQWLEQSWIWIVVAIALVILMRRGLLGHHGHAGLGGVDGSHHGGGSTDPHSTGGDAGSAGRVPGAAIDPVSGNAVRTDRAVSSVHHGRVFYFESAETRGRFEAEPDKYAASTNGGEALESSAPRHSRHHGC